MKNRDTEKPREAAEPESRRRAILIRVLIAAAALALIVGFFLLNLRWVRAAYAGF